MTMSRRLPFYPVLFCVISACFLTFLVVAWRIAVHAHVQMIPVQDHP
jgi:hypothetical protein